MPSEDVKVSIGADATPFMAAMAKVKAQAASTGKSMGESLGVEGIKSEGRLHSSLKRMAADLAVAKDPAEALGSVMQGLSESVKLSGVAMVAFIATSKLAQMLYAGVEAAQKAKAAVSDALSITATATSKSISQVQEELGRLKKDAEANNLSAMDSATAGAKVLWESITRWQSVWAAAKEDARDYHDIMEKIRVEGDSAATVKLDNENAVLKLKLAGHDKEAEALQREQEIQEQIREQQKDGHTDAVAALKEQLGLENQLTDAEAKRAATKKAQEDQAEKVRGLQGQLDELEKKDADDDEKKKTPQQRLAEGADKQNLGFAQWQMASQKNDQEAMLKARLLQQQGIDEQKAAREEIAKSNFETFKKGNETDAKGADLQAKKRKATANVQGASMLGSADVSSMRKIGLGGAVGVQKESPELKAANSNLQKILQAIKQQTTHLEGIRST